MCKSVEKNFYFFKKNIILPFPVVSLAFDAFDFSLQVMDFYAGNSSLAGEIF